MTRSRLPHNGEHQVCRGSSCKKYFTHRAAGQARSRCRSGPVRKSIPDLLASLDEAVVRIARWSRGHVMIHLANFSQAMTRQVDESLAGRLIDMYDGGRAARDARSKQAPGGPPRR